MFFFLELFLKEGMKEIIYTTIQILLKPDTSLEIIITFFSSFELFLKEERRERKRKSFKMGN